MFASSCTALSSALHEIGMDYIRSLWAVRCHPSEPNTPSRSSHNVWKSTCVCEWVCVVYLYVCFGERRVPVLLVV